MNYFEQLEKEFNLYVPRTKTLKYQYPGTDLLKKDVLDHLLSLLGTSIGSSSIIVTSSLFAKYYSYLVTSGVFYVLSHYHQPMDLSLNNMTLHTNEQWEPIIQLHDSRMNGAESLTREGLRDEVIRRVFAYNLKPIYDLLRQISRIDAKTLWAHASYAIHWCYDKWIEQAKDEQTIQQLNEDLAYITKEASGELFGMPGKKNPLNIPFKVIDHPLEQEKKLRIRNKCCLRYRLADNLHCTTCPMITEAERKELLQKYSH